MSYYLEPDSHIRDKAEEVLDLSNYSTKKELYHATGVDTFNLTAEKDFIALKAEVDKFNINKLINVWTSLKIFKTKVDDLEVAKLKTVLVGLKKVNDVVDNAAIKNIKFNHSHKKQIVWKHVPNRPFYTLVLRIKLY